VWQRLKDDVTVMRSKSFVTECGPTQPMGGVVGAVKAALQHVLLHCGEKRIR
jgi:hypothetical protein